MVTEVSYAQNRTDTQAQKGIGAELSPSGAVFDFLQAVKLDTGAGLKLGNSATGGTSTSRSGKLIGTITAQVVEVLPNGDLRIRGVREVSVNREKEQMTVTGIVRQRDISPGNTIPSTMVADAQIVLGRHLYRRKGRRLQNALGRIGLLVELDLLAAAGVAAWNRFRSCQVANSSVRRGG